MPKQLTSQRCSGSGYVPDLAGPKRSRAPRGPIFVAGSDRSGKTLLRWLLSTLPDVAISRRTEMWPRFYGRFGSLSSSRNLDRCLAAMLERKQICALEPDPDRIRRDFRAGEPTYARLFQTIHEHYAALNGRCRWGDQSGSVERFADAVIGSYAGAKFVHMVRDPRDCHHARVERGAGSDRQLGRSTGRWLTSVALAHRNERVHPSSYLVVTYERLVTHSAETLRGICAFLEEEYRPEMLRLDGVHRYDEQRATAANGSPISAKHVGCFRDSLDPCDQVFIQGLAHRRMRSLGYVPEHVPLDARHRTRGIVDVWPRALAGMVARRVLDSVEGRWIAHTSEGHTA